MTEKIPVTITYLKQTEPPGISHALSPPAGVAIMRATDPPIHFYRYMYDLVGAPYLWVSRKQMTDEALGAIIAHDDVRIYVLYYFGVPIGFSEIDGRDKNATEIRFFGIDKNHHGRGLGRFFLTQTIALAWQTGPKLVRLETCTLDHPAALPLYQKLGFSVFDQKQGQVELP